MFTNKVHVCWSYLPTHCYQFTQENKSLHSPRSKHLTLQILDKNLLGQKLVPAAPPGLHSAQTRHDFALRELVQCEQLAPDHDPSVKTQKYFFFKYQQNYLVVYRDFAVNFAK